jgi:RNA polymerase-binding transcription factor DksA
MDPDTFEADEPTTSMPAEPLDLDRIAADLDGVEVALARLDSGTYWTDEVSGEPLSEQLLAESPTARQA